MASMSDFLENRLIDGLMRGGCLTTAGAAGSTNVVKGIWTATTAYAQGDIVVPHANMTGAGGKLMQCTVAGTSGSTNTLAVGNPYSTTFSDGTVTWTPIATIPVPAFSVALLRATAGKSPRSTAVTSGQTTVPATSNGRMYRCTTAGTTGAGEPTWGTVSGGTTADGTAVWTEMTPDLEANNSNVTSVEVSGSAYVRSNMAPSLTNWAGTQSAGSTTASSGTSGTTSNNSAINFATPSADWGWCVAAALYDQPAGGAAGNMLFYGILTVPKYVNNGDTVSFAAGTMSLQIDN